MGSTKNYYIKSNRSFSFIRKYAWIITMLIAIGGHWVPKLGLIVLFIMGSLTIMAFFNGRYWCGNFCPHGSLFDRIILPISKNSKIPSFFKSKATIIGFFTFFIANFIRRLVEVFQAWETMSFLDKLGGLFSKTYLLVLIAGGIMAIFINSRTWCQFCPMGTMQKISHALGKALGVTKLTEKKITISDKSKCYSCGKCTKVCPFQLTPYLEFSEQNQFDHVDCIKCSTCIVNCPSKILTLERENEVVYEVEEEVKAS